MFIFYNSIPTLPQNLKFIISTKIFKNLRIIGAMGIMLILTNSLYFKLFDSQMLTLFFGGVAILQFLFLIILFPIRTFYMLYILLFKPHCFHSHSSLFILPLNSFAYRLLKHLKKVYFLSWMLLLFFGSSSIYTIWLFPAFEGQLEIINRIFGLGLFKDIISLSHDLLWPLFNSVFLNLISFINLIDKFINVLIIKLTALTFFLASKFLLLFLFHLFLPFCKVNFFIYKQWNLF